tara:strand:+ start:388 stop:654 length:267 start_codon:yes stop_codon:yes gene_type:complete
MSIAITISIPLLVLVLVETSIVCGRDIARIIKLSERSFKINNMGWSLARKLDFCIRPLSDDIFKTGCTFFEVKKYHVIKSGSERKSHI